MDFKKKRAVAIIVLALFITVTYGGFRYWQYSNAPGRWRTFTGKVTYSPNIDTVCKVFEIDKDTLVRVSCDKTQLDIYNKANKKYLSDNGFGATGDALIQTPFDGQYDKDIKHGDMVTVKAVRIEPNGLSKYKWYEVRVAGTYVKKVR